NGDYARFGSITSGWDHFHEWKRNAEKEPGSLDTETLINGMLTKDRLLDILENYILFDGSRAGGVRKIVARNHQVLGVNNAVASVKKQEDLKALYPAEMRLVHRSSLPAPVTAAEAEDSAWFPAPLIERAHADLGRLGVFWHTQGSGKSYSMAFFTEKVRRMIPGNFTFLLVTDREDLDDQIFRTFVGCGLANENTPRPASGLDLKEILKQNHRYIFSLIHKFNQDVTEPYNLRDDIIVISDEAHRTQSGKFARNLRMALPNASFIGFTGTPLFKNDQLTRRIFGSYISRYDFNRSEKDHSTVKLIYESRGEKLGIARLDLNDRIAEKIEEAELDQHQVDLLQHLLGRDYEVITADDRLDKLAADFVEHCSDRWQCGKSMLICIDKITCARMYQRIKPRWDKKLAELKHLIAKLKTEVSTAIDQDRKESLIKELEQLTGRAQWMESTIIEMIISEAQNEVRDFKKWDFDIIPHRTIMKTGFHTADGKRVQPDDAFKDPEHPFRIAIVCAMWLTGFDVECLSTLYIDKPMKAHNLMQAIARPNRVYPGKDCGVIVDYNGMLKSLRAALAQYATEDPDGTGDDEIVEPIEVLLKSLVQALEATENHLKILGFDPVRLTGTKGFERIRAIRDAADALYTSDEAKRRFIIMAQQVFTRFKVLIHEPASSPFAERHDNIQVIYKKITEIRNTADVTAVLKELHKIVNEAIRTQGTGADQSEGLKVDLSRIDFDKLRDEFRKKVAHKHSALQDIREIVEKRLAQMLAINPLRMDYYKKYQEIIADYNREKDRATVEETFAQLIKLAESLDAEQKRAAEEGLSDEELALFDMLFKENISKTAREKLKQASKVLLASLKRLLKPMHDWTKNTSTQAEVKICILNNLWESLPRPPFTEQEAEALSGRVYDYVWHRSASGKFPDKEMAA
ncbi:MAG: HsdR family type I site-specific deoxyribonuclease, partial [Candidatus Wallbacteria bacterium]|nr:HsdR family type I site-specific deoxyribonuclease [Candidatus Wallbacteria bacterium]